MLTEFPLPLPSPNREQQACAFIHLYLTMQVYKNWKAQSPDLNLPNPGAKFPPACAMPWVGGWYT